MCITFPFLHRVLYWSQWTSSPTIRRTYLTEQSGSSPSLSGTATIVSTKLSEPLGLTIDFVHGRLYWADPGRGSVESVDLNGGNRVTVCLFVDGLQCQVEGNSLCRCSSHRLTTHQMWHFSSQK